MKGFKLEFIVTSSPGSRSSKSESLVNSLRIFTVEAGCLQLPLKSANLRCLTSRTSLRLSTGTFGDTSREFRGLILSTLPSTFISVIVVGPTTCISSRTWKVLGKSPSVDSVLIPKRVRLPNSTLPWVGKSIVISIFFPVGFSRVISRTFKPVRSPSRCIEREFRVLIVSLDNLTDRSITNFCRGVTSRLKNPIISVSIL